MDALPRHRLLSQKQNQPQKPVSSNRGRAHTTTLAPPHLEHPILQMQRTIGNQAMLRLLQTQAVEPEAGLTGAASPLLGHNFSRVPLQPPAPRAKQTNVEISRPEDECEQEADRISEQVMATTTHHAVRGAPLHIQRLAAQPTGPANAIPASVEQTLATSGTPLEPALRQDMERRFGHDFSSVRVHTGEAAEKSAQNANAQAYTVGADIVFGAGRFAPGKNEGRRLLAHELTLVVQQHNHHPRIQRQSTTLLNPSAAAAAAADVTNRYDEDSIRTLESFSGQTADGVFDAADAEALAQAQHAAALTPSGKADVATLNFLLRTVTPSPAKRSALIHLVVDHANIDVSGALNVVPDPNLTAASESDTLPGGVSTIKIGDRGFASYSVMVAEIRKRLAATPAASPLTPVPPAVFTDTLYQKTAIFFNTARINDRRSIRLLQGALGSKATGQWDVDLVRHVAAKEQTLGLAPSGVIGEGTLAAIASDMIAVGSHDGVLQLIVDYYNLDRSHAFNIVFDPNPPPGKPFAEAETTRATTGTGTPGVVHVFPLAFTQPFAGLVHTVAHELGHIQQVMQGIGSEDVREFLSEGIEIESGTLPMESIESDADIDLMNRNQQPAHGGFILDANRMLFHWGQMLAAEKQTHHQRFKELRQIIERRIATEASPSQKTKLATFLNRLKTADNGVP